MSTCHSAVFTIMIIINIICVQQKANEVKKSIAIAPRGPETFQGKKIRSLSVWLDIDQVETTNTLLKD